MVFAPAKQSAAHLLFWATSKLAGTSKVASKFVPGLIDWRELRLKIVKVSLFPPCLSSVPSRCRRSAKLDRLVAPLIPIILCIFKQLHENRWWIATAAGLRLLLVLTVNSLEWGKEHQGRAKTCRGVSMATSARPVIFLPGPVRESKGCKPPVVSGWLLSKPIFIVSECTHTHTQCTTDLRRHV